MDIRTLTGLLAKTYRFRQHDHARRAQLKAYQTHALYKLRAHAYTRSPFYGQFHKNLMDRPFGELPVLTREMLMEHFDELVTDRRVRRADVEAHLSSMPGDEQFLGRYRVNATSGSSGRPGIFLFNRSEWAALLAARARARAWSGLRVDLTRQVRTAFITSTGSWHMSAQIGATVRSWWAPELRLDAGMPIAAMVEQLNAWQPEVLVADASMAHRLADEQRAGRLRIAPERIFTSAEVLTDTARRTIEAVWGKRLFDQYAATETGMIAAECAEHRGLHILEDQIILEVVDERNRPVPLGAEGDKVLITTLFSRTLPLIRYELHDRVRLAMKPCSCGRPLALINEIQGRTEDMLAFPAAAGNTITMHPHVFHRIMDSVPAGAWRIVRDAAGVEVLLSGVRDGFDDTALAESLRRTLTAQGASVLPIRIQRVSSLPQSSASGKVLVIASRTNGSAPGTPAALLSTKLPDGREREPDL